MYKPSAVNVPIIRLLMKVTILHVKLIIIKLHLQTFRRLLFLVNIDMIQMQNTEVVPRYRLWSHASL